VSYQSVIDEHFPGTIEEGAFVERTLSLLEPHGFTAENSIVCVGVCRDELCRSLGAGAVVTWGEAFNFSSLGGMLFLGKTGFQAAHDHAPVVNGKQRYVYMSFAHIGIGPEGQLGQCVRSGRDATSIACGALGALRDELLSGHVDTQRSPDDVEQSLLKESLLSRLAWGEKPDLVQLTKVAREVAFDTLERMVALTVDTQRADYAVFSGVQIHGPDNAPFIWSAQSYAVLSGNRIDI
jgi:hypothetical protein